MDSRYTVISNAIKIEGTKITKARRTGNNPVQLKRISWSYRRRGKLALTQMKKNKIKQTLRPKIKLSNEK